MCVAQNQLAAVKFYFTGFFHCEAAEHPGELHGAQLSKYKHFPCPALPTLQAQGRQKDVIWQVSAWLEGISQTKAPANISGDPQLTTYLPNPGLNLLPGTP